MRVPDFAGNGEYEINNSPEAQMGNARTHFRNEVSSKKPSRAKHGHRVACHFPENQAGDPAAAT